MAAQQCALPNSMPRCTSGDPVKLRVPTKGCTHTAQVTYNNKRLLLRLNTVNQSKSRASGQCSPQQAPTAAGLCCQAPSTCCAWGWLFPQQLQPLSLPAVQLTL